MAKSASKQTHNQKTAKLLVSIVIAMILVAVIVFGAFAIAKIARDRNSEKDSSQDTTTASEILQTEDDLKDEDKGRLMEVEWDTPSDKLKYYVDIQVTSEERKGMFKVISKVCDDNDIEVVGLNLTDGESGTTNTLLKVE